MKINPAAAELDELLEASYNLPDAICDLGRLQLGFTQLQTAAHARIPRNAEVDAKAHYLLAGSGFNAEQVLSEISRIHFARSLDHHLKPGVSSDVEGYLTSKKEDHVFSSVDALVRQSWQDFDLFLNKMLVVDWKTRKQQLYQILGFDATLTTASSSSKGSQTPGLADDPKAQSVAWKKNRIGSTILGPPSTNLPSPAELQKSVEFSKVIAEFHDARSAKTAFSLARQLGSVARRYNSGNSPQINDMWGAVELLAQAPLEGRTLRELYQRRQPADIALLDRIIVKQSLNFLQLQYRVYIDGEIDKHRQEAQLGGVPSRYNKVKSFVLLKYFKDGEWDQRLGVVNKTPIWAHLYYLLRAGYMKEALEVVLEREDIFGFAESSFAAYFKAYIQSEDHVLPAPLLDMVRSDYAQLFRAGTVFDPFKQALYKIIGRCDLQRRSLPQVATTTEDWLWLQLTFIRTQEPDKAELRNDRYTLEDLQCLVLQIGPSHFDPAGQNPGKYFGVLLLVGLYERAVVALHSTNEIYAIHYAVALAYHGLLNVVEEARVADVPLLEEGSDENPDRFNYLVAVGSYTRIFRQTQPEEAVTYLMLLSLTISELYPPRPVRACCEALQELVLETRRFSELLGDITGLQGQPIPGAIEKRKAFAGLHSRSEFLHEIPHMAAIKAEEDGRQLDAILLFYLAEEHDRVMDSINSIVSQTLASIELGQPLPSIPAGSRSKSGFVTSEDPIQLARNMLKVTEHNRQVAEAAGKDRLATCANLLAFADAMGLLAAGSYERCLETIERTGLVDLAPDVTVADISKQASDLLAYPEPIIRVVPTLLLMTMECCVSIYQRLRASGNPVAMQMISECRQRASHCMIYAGLIQYRMPRAMYTRLTHLEVQLS